MEIIHDLNQFGPPSRGSAVTIGNFDGVHLAHQELLRRTVEHARELESIAVAITFEPHPIQVLAPDRAPRILTSLATRARRIEQMGIDLLVVLPFTRDLAHLSPLDFVEQILMARLHANFLCVGPNFRFGYRQAGDVSLLRRLSPSWRYAGGPSQAPAFGNCSRRVEFIWRVGSWAGPSRIPARLFQAGALDVVMPFRL